MKPFMKGVGRGRIRISGLSPYRCGSRCQGQGVAQTFLEGLIEGFDYLDFRSDTHAQNKAMQHIFEKLGFQQVGKVPVDGERLAYQKLKK